MIGRRNDWRARSNRARRNLDELDEACARGHRARPGDGRRLPITPTPTTTSMMRPTDADEAHNEQTVIGGDRLTRRVRRREISARAASLRLTWRRVCARLLLQRAFASAPAKCAPKRPTDRPTDGDTSAQVSAQVSGFVFLKEPPL